MIVHAQLGDNAFCVGEGHSYRVEDSGEYGYVVRGSSNVWADEESLILVNDADGLDSIIDALIERRDLRRRNSL